MTELVSKCLDIIHNCKEEVEAQLYISRHPLMVQIREAEGFLSLLDRFRWEDDYDIAWAAADCIERDQFCSNGWVQYAIDEGL